MEFSQLIIEIHKLRGRPIGRMENGQANVFLRGPEHRSGLVFRSLLFHHGLGGLLPASFGKLLRYPRIGMVAKFGKLCYPYWECEDLIAFQLN